MLKKLFAQVQDLTLKFEVNLEPRSAVLLGHEHLGQMFYNVENGTRFGLYYFFAKNLEIEVRTLQLVCQIAVYSITICGFAYGQDKDPIEELKGVWQAESIEVAGKLAPEEPTKLMRFTFNEKAVLIRGNFRDEREESCKFKLDATKSPKQIDIQPPNDKEPIIGIYRIVDGKLEICLRKDSKERPNEFKASKEDPKNVLVKFKREPAQK